MPSVGEKAHHYENTTIQISEFSLGFWKQEFKNPSLRKVGVKIEK